MHRIDTPGNRDNRFDDGNELAGRQGTVVDADWLNACQEEIAGAIEGLGDDPLEKGTNDQLLSAITSAIAAAKDQAKRESWPVGSVYWNYEDSRNPATILGFGVWVAHLKGRVPIGIGYNGQSWYYAAQTGGQDYVTLNESQLPLVTLDSLRNGSGGYDSGNSRGRGGDEYEYPLSFGSGYSHENRMPYQTHYVWRRTA